MDLEGFCVLVLFLEDWAALRRRILEAVDFHQLVLWGSYGDWVRYRLLFNQDTITSITNWICAGVFWGTNDLHRCV